MTSKNNLRLLTVLAVALLVATGCAPKSPEEKVAQLRSFYSARAIGFLVDAVPEEPMVDPDAEEGAEGVEDESQLAALRDLGVNAAQGFLIGRPLRADDLDHWLTKRVAGEELSETFIARALA